MLRTTQLPTRETDLTQDRGTTSVRSHGRRWRQKVGLAGFLFFLVKGLIWLLLGALAYFGLTE